MHYTPAKVINRTPVQVLISFVPAFCLALLGWTAQGNASASRGLFKSKDVKSTAGMNRINTAPCSMHSSEPQRFVELLESQLAVHHVGTAKHYSASVLCLAGAASNEAKILNKGQRNATLKPGDLCVIDSVGYHCSAGHPKFTHAITAECEEVRSPESSEKKEPVLKDGPLFRSSGFLSPWVLPSRNQPDPLDIQVIYVRLPLAAIDLGSAPGEYDRLNDRALPELTEACQSLSEANQTKSESQPKKYMFKRVLGLPKILQPGQSG